MFSHVMLGSDDIERSKKFYDAVFSAIGGKPGRVDPNGRLIISIVATCSWSASRSTARRQ